MPYGHFSKDASEYIVTRFDTPRPWINVLFNEVYGVYVSHELLGRPFSPHLRTEALTLTQ